MVDSDVKNVRPNQLLGDVVKKNYQPGDHPYIMVWL
jgi:hypothetical protein